MKRGRSSALWCFKTAFWLESLPAILVALVPLIRITAIAEKPEGVDWDTIVATDTKSPFMFLVCWELIFVGL